MKKTLSLFLLFAYTLSLSAQSKKELQDNINLLNQQAGELKATIALKNEQLEQANKTIAELQQQLSAQQSVAKKPNNYRDSIAIVLEKFINSESWEEASEYVMEPERVKPIMHSYYQTNSFKINNITIDEILKGRFDKRSGKTHLIYIWDMPRSSSSSGWGPRYIVKTADGYKVDWEATVKYNPVTAADLIEKPGTTAVIRRPNVHLYTYDNDWYYNFGSQGNSYILAQKKSTVGKYLYDLLKEGSWSDMILKMKSIEEDDNIYLEIQEVVSPTLSTY